MRKTRTIAFALVLSACGDRAVLGALDDGGACAPGLYACAGACVEILRDEAHCGRCGVACGAGETCAGGTCALCGGTGEACCDESECNADFVCASEQCVACGGDGQLCCDGDMCGAGLMCDAETCRPSCGRQGQACCPPADCAEGRCEGDSCTCTPAETACGDPFDDDCDGNLNCEDADCDGEPCGPGMTCESGECRMPSCGLVGQPCCAGEMCLNGATCTSGVCSCGETDESSCTMGSGDEDCDGLVDCADSPECDLRPCDADAVCWGMTCVLCGTVGRACCEDSTCSEGTCEEGMCACGAIGQPCCSGETCDAPGVCVGGSCCASDVWTPVTGCGGCGPSCGSTCTGTRTERNACGTTRSAPCTVTGDPCPRCGDGPCDPGESCGTCAQDCGCCEACQWRGGNCDRSPPCGSPCDRKFDEWCPNPSNCTQFLPTGRYDCWPESISSCGSPPDNIPGCST
jgi:hypothetical protein